MKWLSPPQMVITACLVAVVTAVFGGSTLAEDQPVVSVNITPDEHIVVDSDGNFTVPLNTRVVWTVEVIVVNPSDNTATFEDVFWFNNYDAALEFEDVAYSAGTTATYTSPSPPTQIHWTIGTLEPGEGRTLTFDLATRVNRGGVQLYGDTGCEPWESGADLHYRVRDASGRLLPGNRSLEFEARTRCVEEDPPWVTFELTTRKDWRVRRPGCYASPTTTLYLASNDRVSVEFGDFGNLEYLDDAGAPSIPTYYARGADIGEAEAYGWQEADAFNGTVWSYGPSSALEAGVYDTLWSKICVGLEHPSSDYGDEGWVLVVLENGSTYVAPEE